MILQCRQPQGLTIPLLTLTINVSQDLSIFTKNQSIITKVSVYGLDFIWYEEKLIFTISGS